MAVQVTYEQLQHFVALMVFLSFLCGVAGFLFVRTLIGAIAFLGGLLSKSARIDAARQRAAERAFFNNGGSHG